MILDEELITRAPIIDSRTYLRLTQEVLVRIYLDYQSDEFKIYNDFVYSVVSKIFTDMDAYT